MLPGTLCGSDGSTKFMEDRDIGVKKKKPDAEPMKGIGTYWTSALTSVMSKWCGACIILRLEQEAEPDGGRQVHVGGIDDISCQHLQMMTQSLQKTLGVARGQKTNDEAWQCDTTCNVFGQHGHQDGVRFGKNIRMVMMSTDGFLRLCCVKWLVWKDRPLSSVLLHLRDASAKEASKPPGFG